MKYRMLKKGLIKRGDEYRPKPSMFMLQGWKKVGPSIGEKAEEYTNLIFRRPIKSTRTKYEMEFRWFREKCRHHNLHNYCDNMMNEAEVCNAKNCPAIKKLKPITPPKEVE